MSCETKRTQRIRFPHNHAWKWKRTSPIPQPIFTVWKTDLRVMGPLWTGWHAKWENSAAGGIIWEKGRGTTNGVKKFPSTHAYLNSVQSAQLSVQSMPKDVSEQFTKECCVWYTLSLPLFKHLCRFCTLVQHSLILCVLYRNSCLFSSFIGFK